MRDLIFVSMEDWDEVWRRNQFLCAALARRFPQMKILFVGLTINVSHHIRHGSVGKIFRQMTWQVPGFRNITVMHAIKLLPDSITPARKFNEFVARTQIRGVAERLGMRNPILWLNPHSSVHMPGLMGERCVVYDITDDWGLVPSLTPSERKLTIEQDRALTSRADLVVVCSEALERSRREQAREILLVPNGVDVTHYAAVGSPTADRPWPGPVFGYTGTLHTDRTDVRIIIDLARAFPRGSVVLVGPDHWKPRDRELLALEKNVFMPGAVPYSKIPGIMSQFDVCIVPHVETTFTESLNPIKLWEYLAGGKPIVSTNIAGFRDYPHLCRIASSSDAFIAACRVALEEGTALRDARIAEASLHTWEARLDMLLENFEKHDWIPAAGALAPA